MKEVGVKVIKLYLKYEKCCNTYEIYSRWNKMDKYTGFEIQKSLAKNLTLLFTAHMTYYTT